MDWSQGAVGINDSSDSEEGPARFKNLQDVYQDTVEVELTLDIEVEALLSVMEEPSCFKDATGDS